MVMVNNPLSGIGDTKTLKVVEKTQNMVMVNNPLSGIGDAKTLKGEEKTQNKGTAQKAHIVMIRSLTSEIQTQLTT